LKKSSITVKTPLVSQDKGRGLWWNTKIVTSRDSGIITIGLFGILACIAWDIHLIKRGLDHEYSCESLKNQSAAFCGEMKEGST
jgi:hypothetical protein